MPPVKPSTRFINFIIILKYRICCFIIKLSCSTQAARRLKLRNIAEYRNLNGGAAIELAASRATDPTRFKFELPMAQRRDCNFSFAGLKNTVQRWAVRQEIEYNVVGDGIIPDLNNLCAGFQMAIAKHLSHRAKRAMEFALATNLIPKNNLTLVRFSVAVVAVLTEYIYIYICIHFRWPPEE